MTIRDKINQNLMAAVDHVQSMIPRPRPSITKLKSTRLVSHRGANRLAPENTLRAFDLAVQSGTWGLECDVRFTRDHEAIVLHDKDTMRVFGESVVVENIELRDLRRLRPEIPTLSEVLSRYKGSAHLMIELKASALPVSQRPRRFDIVARELSGLKPGEDFHLLSLHADILLQAEFVPRHARLPVAEWNTEAMSRLALSEKFAGVTGHYLVMSQSLIRKHHEAGQKIGTGFVSSRSVLYREINREVDWIFTNHIAEISDSLNEEYSRGSAVPSGGSSAAES